MPSFADQSLLLLGLDAYLECLNDLGIYLVEAYVYSDVELLNDTRRHLPNLLVDLHKVQVDYECTLRILQGHLVKLLQHYRNEQIVGLIDLEEVDENEVDNALQNAEGVAVLLLFKNFEDALDETINSTENQKELLMLEVSRVVLKILQAYREELADYDETNQVLNVADVEFAYETLHFCI